MKEKNCSWGCLLRSTIRIPRSVSIHNLIFHICTVLYSVHCLGGGGGGEDEPGHLVIIIYISPFLRVARSWQKNNVVS